MPRDHRAPGVSRRLSAFLLAILLAPLALQAEPVVLHRETDRQPVTGGVELIRIRQFDSLGWLNIAAVEIDHAEPHLHLDALLGRDRLTGSQPLSRTARNRGAVAAANGDFFHILTTSAPHGIHLQSGELFKSPEPGHVLAAGFGGGDGLTPYIGPAAFTGRVTTADGDSRELSGWNEENIPSNGLIYYNRRWGAASPAPESADIACAVLDRDQRVERLVEGAGEMAIPEEGGLLFGRGKSASWLLRHARPGHVLNVAHEFNPSSLVAAIGGNPLLLKDGQIMVPEGGDIHPRTAFGFSREKTRSWLVVVDGRSSLSRGVSLHELATIMKDFGAHDALNLDGGGSSTLLARTPESEGAIVQNISSDGRERSIPNGLGVFHVAPAGAIEKLFLRQPAPRGAHTLKTDALRLPPGSSFRPTAHATDKYFNPVALPDDLSWSVVPDELGSFSSDGSFRPRLPGVGQITASASIEGDLLGGSMPIRVTGEPVLLEIAPAGFTLSPGKKLDLAVRTMDAGGYSAPLPEENVTWEIQDGIGHVSNGAFIAGENLATGKLVARFGDLKATAPVAIGEHEILLAAFDDDAQWRATAAPPGTGSRLSFVDHLPYIRERERTARLAYDFPKSDRIRAAYLRPREKDIALPGRPHRLGLWVFGDGKGAWLRGHLVDPTGSVRSIDFARNIDWTGWRYVEAGVPSGIDYPVSLRSIYVVETDPTARYSGAVYFDELTAGNVPDLEIDFPAPEEKLRDPANRPVEIGKTGEENYRFIVLGGPSFRGGNSGALESRLLTAMVEEINRQDVEFVLFTADLVETADDESYRGAQQFLDRIQKPSYTTASNHEHPGMEKYRELSGATFHSFSRGGSEFIILNTARPGLRASELEQWPWLRDRLEKTPAKNLFFLTHTPVVDPIPGGKNGWSDETEAALFQDLLTALAEKGRTVYLFSGDEYGFNRRIFDGVQYLTSAGARGPLRLPARHGGFFHYLLVTVKEAEVTYQVVPLLQKIELEEEIETTAGMTLDLDAQGITLGEPIAFPLGYPAAAEWTIADPEVVRVDAAAGALHALAPGETEVTVRSGRVSASARIIVRP